MHTESAITTKNSPSQSIAFELGELDWIEKAAVEHLKQRVECADVLAKEAATTLTVLLAGAGGSLAYGIKIADGDFSASVLIATFVCVWLAICAILLVHKCLKIEAIALVYNEPKNHLLRLTSDASFENWRKEELLGMQVRIDANTLRNDRTAKSLNHVRTMAAATPAIALVVSAVIKFF